MLKIAIPNKGSLSNDSITLLSDAGYHVKRLGRELKLIDSENQIEFIFLRPKDIAVYVGNGVLDLGITGRDLVVDSETHAEELCTLGFGKSAFFYAVPQASTLNPNDFGGKRIATSYPNLVALDLHKRKIKARVIKLDGAIEISINLGVADVIADVVQTGRTLQEAGLKTIGDAVLQSEAVLIGRDLDMADRSDVKTVIDRVRGIVVARDYVMIEYDVSKENLKNACDITPGIEAPTVAPLSRDGWFAVKAMARKRGINAIIDDLSREGCKGIIVSDIRTCRI
ncbi:MAG: ATP phosphoribosyltransferase [Proteobacteria bacterium]|nr:ATP phosphoribosyltransferase [Pseudomonadota bacterium]